MFNLEEGGRFSLPLICVQKAMGGLFLFVTFLSCSVFYRVRVQCFHCLVAHKWPHAWLRARALSPCLIG